tara:strand:- start:227 stop:1318 length:1092 start_codon:yes stop_codon:yes gene_type:complete
VITYQKALIAHGITGSNFARVYLDSDVLVHSIVNSNKENDMDINENTIFPIWSMTKPITIVAMMILYEKNLYKFDDPVSDYIPSLGKIKCKNEDSVYNCNNQLKIIHLLTHRSGFKYYSGGSGNITHADTAFNSLSEYIDSLVQYQPLEFEPGTEYMYGINQAILGGLIEVISGQSFYDFLNQNIFKPLNMNNTKFYLTENERENFQILFKKSDDGKERIFSNDNDQLTYRMGSKMQFGGEGLVSTFNDYSNFCQMLLNGGSFNSQKIISQKSIELMIKPHTINILEDGYYGGVDFGFSLFNLQEPILDGTNSSKGIYGWSGYHNTHFWIDPKKNLYGLFMTRTVPFSFEIQKQFRAAVYSNI